MKPKTRYAQQFLDNPPRGLRAFTDAIRAWTWVLYKIFMMRLGRGTSGGAAHREELHRIIWLVLAPQIFELRDDGLSAEETAARLGLDIQVVRRVLHAGAAGFHGPRWRMWR
jgi:hypothetical protein